MSRQFAVFIVGDHVQHSSRGEGVVIAKSADSVTVHFGEDAKGKPRIGIYDEHWFAWAERQGTSLINLMEAA